MDIIFPEKLLARAILPEIIPFLEAENIVLLTGARQTGKTSLMLRMKSKIEKEVACFYFDLEKPQDLERVRQDAKNSCNI